MTAHEILTALKSNSQPVGNHIPPNHSGVYAIFLNGSVRLGDLPTSDGQLVYIGESSNLYERKHFDSGHTGFSTLRRSLGAILKEELALKPIPRSEGSKKSFYKFKPDGEERLSSWMHKNLELGFAAISGNYKDIEMELIQLAEPILNLTYWDNPYRNDIKRLRKACAEEAQINLL